jgi:hypothetical protein
VCLTTILVLQNAKTYRDAALQQEQQQKARIRVARETLTSITENPTDLDTSNILEMKKKRELRNRNKREEVIVEEKHVNQLEMVSAIIDDSPTPIIDGYFDELITRDDNDKKVAPNSITTTTLAELPKTTLTLCRNTVVGNMFITDSRGYTCRIEHVDRVTRCCNTQVKAITNRHSCKSCNIKFGCCSVYEYCVACCMAPEHRQELQNNFKERKNDRLYRGIKTVFQFCSTRCRTSSRSVINENRYRSPLKHCYAKQDPADLELPTTNMP